MKQPPLYAVLIGVEQYPDLPGDDAPGCVNDVIAMSTVFQHLGARPAEVHALTSPAPAHREELADGAVGTLGLATRDAILGAVRELIAHLRSDETALGVVYYSGHGACREGHLLLCPADTNARLDGTISFEELLALIGDEPLPRLTFALDCCYAGAAAPDPSGAPPAMVRTLTPGPLPAGAERWFDALAARAVLLAATGPGQLSYAYSLRPDLDVRKVVHGVFTMGLSALLQRWSPVGTEETQIFPITYAQLVSRLVQYCAALAFDQTPQVSGPLGVDGWVVFRDWGGGRSAPAVPGREITGGATDCIWGDIVTTANQPSFLGYYVEGPSGTTPTAFWVAGAPGGQAYKVVPPSVKIATNGPYTVAALSGTLSGSTVKLPYFDVLSTGTPAVLLGTFVVGSNWAAWLTTAAGWQSACKILPGTPAAAVQGDRGPALGGPATGFVANTAAIQPTCTIAQPAGTTVGWLVKAADGTLCWYNDDGKPFACAVGSPLLLAAASGPALTPEYKAVDGT
jgi:hypothetical protein